MEMKLEVIIVPVSDVDRAKRFYEGLGFRLDIDHAQGKTFRVVQLTPPGSACSIIIGKGITGAKPGSVGGLHLVVEDIGKARNQLVARGATLTEIFHDAGGVFHHAGKADSIPGPDPARKSYASFASFADPDGNGWFIQEITERASGR